MTIDKSKASFLTTNYHRPYFISRRSAATTESYGGFEVVTQVTAFPTFRKLPGMTDDAGVLVGLLLFGAGSEPLRLQFIEYLPEIDKRTGSFVHIFALDDARLVGELGGIIDTAFGINKGKPAGRSNRAGISEDSRRMGRSIEMNKAISTLGIDGSLLPCLVLRSPCDSDWIEILHFPESCRDGLQPGRDLLELIMDNLGSDVGETPPSIADLKARVRKLGMAVDNHFSVDLARVAAENARTSQRITTSPDFRQVIWGDSVFTFSPHQAAAVRVMFRSWEDGGLGLGQETIGEAVDQVQGNFRLRNLFRNGTKTHPAWDTMIKSLGKGVFGLVDPE